MKKLFIPLVFAVLMITACSGEYNKTFKMAYEKASTIETDSYITWKMIESSASSPEDVLDFHDELDGGKTKASLDSMKILIDRLSEIDKENESFRDISDLYDKCVKVVECVKNRDIAGLDIANFELNTFFEEFMERNKSRIK